MLAGKIVGPEAGYIAAAQTHQVRQPKEIRPKPSRNPTGRTEKSKNTIRAQAAHTPKAQQRGGKHEDDLFAGGGAVGLPAQAGQAQDTYAIYNFFAGQLFIGRS